jgi:hypothetical protein
MKNPTAAICLATVFVVAVMPAAEADKLTRLRGERSPSELANDERKLSGSKSSGKGEKKGHKKAGKKGEGRGGVPDRDFL